MGLKSKIEWCDDTWNPAVGCTKVSPGCRDCYMMRAEVRYGRDGKKVRRTKPGTFDLPIKRDRTGAYKIAPGRLVFTASLTDVFHEDFDAHRNDMWARMEARPDVLFLVLTKRPERIDGRLPSWWGPYGPANVALGVSAENQAAWDARVPVLRTIPARLRFVSVEPMIGAIPNPHGLEDLGWIIIGGESGPTARPMHPRWAKDLILAAEDDGVPVHFKQWGRWKPISDMPEPEHSALYRSKRIAKEFEDQATLDECYGRRCTVATLSLGVDGEHLDLLHPKAWWQGRQAVQAFRVGESAAGRVINGRTYDARPSWPLKIPTAAPRGWARAGGWEPVDVAEALRVLECGEALACGEALTWLLDRAAAASPVVNIAGLRVNLKEKLPAHLAVALAREGMAPLWSLSLLAGLLRHLKQPRNLQDDIPGPLLTWLVALARRPCSPEESRAEAAWQRREEDPLGWRQVHVAAPLLARMLLVKLNLPVLVDRRLGLAPLIVHLETVEQLQHEAPRWWAAYAILGEGCHLEEVAVQRARQLATDLPELVQTHVLVGLLAHLGLEEAERLVERLAAVDPAWRVSLLRHTCRRAWVRGWRDLAWSALDALERVDGPLKAKALARATEIRRDFEREARR